MDPVDVARLRNLDEKEWKKAFDLLQPIAVAKATSILKDVARSEDATQEALLALVDQLPGHKDLTDWAAVVRYFRRILMNKIVDSGRRAARFLQTADPEKDRPFETPDPHPLASVHAQVDLKWHANILLASLAGLGEPCGSLLIRHYYWGESYAEIALESKEREANLRLHSFRCLRKLRKVLPPGYLAELRKA
jgi:RNA polymerase sigma factor (sigma-70 family)